SCCSCSPYSQATNENLPPNVIKQLAKELKSLNESPPEGIKVGVNDDDLSVIFADIEGPGKFRPNADGTPYENGVFRMKLLLPHDFPKLPPQGFLSFNLVQSIDSLGFFLTKIFHPNISSDGKICVNTLKKDWNPSLGLRHVLVVVRCLLIEPFPESALNEQASKMLLDNYEDYFKHARLLTGIHAKPKPKPKTGAISESTTALNVDKTNTSVPSIIDHKNTTPASDAEPLSSTLPPCSTTPNGELSTDQVSSTGTTTLVETGDTAQPVMLSTKQSTRVVKKNAAEKKKMDARKKSLKRL
ncbi:Ubiquitin-conjugating enzyme E2 22, partial [Linum perenne]